MIKFKTNRIAGYEETIREYFQELLNQINDKGCLSSLIDEVIITDNLDEEISRFANSQSPRATRSHSRDYIAIGKTVRHNETRKVLFDANYLFSGSDLVPTIFLEQFLEVHAEEIVEKRFSTAHKYYPETPFPKVVEIVFSGWASKIICKLSKSVFDFPQMQVHSRVKPYIEAFKRDVRKHHYKYQEDVDLGDFWIKTATDLDFLIDRCLDVKYDNGSFKQLQEFESIIPLLLSEVELQVQHLLSDIEVDLTQLRTYILKILKKCFIEIPDEHRMYVKITDSPKRLFKKTLVDTEPRLVAFMDILGFSSIVQEYDSDPYSNILNELHETLEVAIQASVETLTMPELQNDLKEFLDYHMFSDCICLSLPYIEFGQDFQTQFHLLTLVAKTYQLSMMQKGFFVRGGISMGSFYADKNMIFSGGLVKAYKIETEATYPVVQVATPVLTRLKKNFTPADRVNFDQAMLYKSDRTEQVFLNPFDTLDNGSSYFDILQSTLESFSPADSKNKDDITELTNSILKLTSEYTKPIFEMVKSQLSPEKVQEIKNNVLEKILKNINKCNNALNSLESSSVEYEGIERVLKKYNYMQSLLEWSMGREDQALFRYYEVAENDKR